jgi:hypothetical protein
MPTGDEYRVKAAELNEKAAVEPNPILRQQFETLVLSYLRLADQADRNSVVDLVYETPASRPVVQQQQQVQSDDE